MCRHCRMDDVWVGWETRLFRLEARAMGAGGYVSHEDALRQVWRIPFCAFNHALHAFQPADQVRCSRHSMTALQPALSWDLLHHVEESPANCRFSLTQSIHCF